jgi:hypothetical protein
MSQFIIRATAIAGIVTTICCQAIAANPKKGPKEAAKEAPKPSAATTTGPRLPADLNLASMRVKALDELYELDLSVDQLKKLRTLAVGAASTKTNSPPKGTDKLTAALQEFQVALLERSDDKQIDELRNKIANLANDDDVSLDDAVPITPAARTKAADVLKQLTASQIAAFVAAHADEVGDPGEMMIATITQILAVRASAESEAAEGKTPPADSTQDNAKEAAELVQDTSTEVGQLVAGLDEARAQSVAADVAKWIQAKSLMKDEEFVAKRQTLTEAARALVGNVHPMRVLDNWLEQKMATLLSNPQLPAAIEAIIQVKQQAE